MGTSDSISNHSVGMGEIIEIATSAPAYKLATSQSAPHGRVPQADGKKVGEGHVLRTHVLFFSMDETMEVGCDVGGLASPD